MPDVSEDVEDSAYEIKLAAKEPSDDSHKKAMRYLQKELPALKEQMKLEHEARVKMGVEKEEEKPQKKVVGRRAEYESMHDAYCADPERSSEYRAAG